MYSQGFRASMLFRDWCWLSHAWGSNCSKVWGGKVLITPKVLWISSPESSTTPLHRPSPERFLQLEGASGGCYFHTFTWAKWSTSSRATNLNISQTIHYTISKDWVYFKQAVHLFSMFRPCQSLLWNHTISAKHYQAVPSLERPWPRSWFGLESLIHGASLWQELEAPPSRIQRIPSPWMIAPPNVEKNVPMRSQTLPHSEPKHKSTVTCSMSCQQMPTVWMAELHTATILTSTSQQQWKISTQPKGPPLAHSKWHAIENPKSEWCKPQRHPKSARSLHLTDCPWCLHVLGGFAMHFAMLEMLVTSRRAPQQPLSISSIFAPLSRGGGKCSLHYSSVVWTFCKKPPTPVYQLTQ